MYCLCPLWLARVITLVLVLRHSNENHSMYLSLVLFSVLFLDLFPGVYRSVTRPPEKEKRKHILGFNKMKNNKNRKSLKTAVLIFIDFQYQSINCYWFLLTIIDVIYYWFWFNGILHQRSNPVTNKYNRKSMCVKQTSFISSQCGTRGKNNILLYTIIYPVFKRK